MKPLVLFVVASSRGIGGVETWVARFVQYLNERDWPVRLAMLRGQRTTDPDQFRRHHPGLVDLEIDGRGLTREGRVRKTASVIRTENPSIVIPLSTYDTVEACCREKLRRKSLHLVSHAQGNLAPQFADARQYACWWDAVVCPGRLTHDWLVKFGDLPAEVVHHVPNGADAPVAVRSKSKAPLRIGFVGRLTQADKRADDLPRIIESTRQLGIDASWSIVGDGPLANQIREQVHGQSNVIFHGAVSPHDVYRSIYPNLDVLLLTSDSEAFGIVIVEAMRHGIVPVVSRYLGGGSERLVIDGVDGLTFPVADHRAAAVCIERLSNDRELIGSLSVAAKRKGDHYTWPRCLQAWEDVLTSVADSPPRVGNSIPQIPRRKTGRLDALPIPTSAVEVFRSIRQRVAPVKSAAGGEEWPLFGRHHSDDELAEIANQLADLDGVER